MEPEKTKPAVTITDGNTTINVSQLPAYLQVKLIEALEFWESELRFDASSAFGKFKDDEARRLRSLSIDVSCVMEGMKNAINEEQSPL